MIKGRDSYSRYVDLYKLISMINTKSFFFSRADLLGDPMEGLNTLWKRNKDTAKNVLKAYKQKDREIVIYENKLIKNIFVLCFYKENNESMAMWKTYLPESQGVLVKFHKEKLLDFINFYEFLSYGEVSYTDLFNVITISSSERKGDFDRFMLKDISFEHENEFRVYFESDDLENIGDTILKPIEFNDTIIGYSLNVNFEEIIKEIVISPFSPEWHKNIVEETLQKYKINTEVRLSYYHDYFWNILYKE